MTPKRNYIKFCKSRLNESLHRSPVTPETAAAESPLDFYYYSFTKTDHRCLAIGAIDAYAEKGNRFPGHVFFFIGRVDLERECGSMARIIEHPGLVWAPSSSSFCRSVRHDLFSPGRGIAIVPQHSHGLLLAVSLRPVLH